MSHSLFNRGSRISFIVVFSDLAFFAKSSEVLWRAYSEANDRRGILADLKGSTNVVAWRSVETNTELHVAA